MSFAYDPRLFLDIAKQLLNDSRYEGKGRTRTSIGRAYYAAFLFTRKRLQGLGHSFADVDKIHKDVIEKLMDRNTAISNMLETLFGHRVDADYKMEAMITLELGKSCVKLSEYIIHSVEQLK